MEMKARCDCAAQYRWSLEALDEWWGEPVLGSESLRSSQVCHGIHGEGLDLPSFPEGFGELERSEPLRLAPPIDYPCSAEFVDFQQNHLIGKWYP